MQPDPPIEEERADADSMARRSGVSAVHTPLFCVTVRHALPGRRGGERSQRLAMQPDSRSSTVAWKHSRDSLPHQPSATIFQHRRLRHLRHASCLPPRLTPASVAPGLGARTRLAAYRRLPPPANRAIVPRTRTARVRTAGCHRASASTTSLMCASMSAGS